MDDSQNSHDKLKENGNKYFSGGHYSKALEYYTKAIEKQPNISVYYTNRALCYLRCHEYEKVIADCRRALEHDPMNIKAFYFMGQAFLEMGAYDEAIPRLLRAHEIAVEQRKNYGDDITAVIRCAKRKRFEVLDAKRRQEEIELHKYLESLILTNGEQIMHKADESEEDAEGVKEDIKMEIQKKLHQVADLFAQVDDRRKKREIPDYLCGKISFELLLDPVITPSGITYDRKSIVEHLQRVGHFDPITRQPMTEDQLITNVSMKEVVNTFIEENPWAEDF